MTSIRVLSVASEIYPMIKTGGLADVVGALPAALKAYGIETRTLVPGYPDVINALSAAEELVHLQDFYGGPARVLGSSYNELDLLVLDAPHLFARPGNPYVTPDGADALCRACANGGRNRSRNSHVVRAGCRARSRLAGRTRAGIFALRQSSSAWDRDDGS